MDISDIILIIKNLKDTETKLGSLGGVKNTDGTTLLMSQMIIN